MARPTPLGALRPARRSPAVRTCLTDRDACPGDSTHLGDFSPSLSPRKCPTHTGKRGCRPFWKKSLRECEQVKTLELRGDGSRCPLPVRRGRGDRHTERKSQGEGTGWADAATSPDARGWTRQEDPPLVPRGVGPPTLWFLTSGPKGCERMRSRKFEATRSVVACDSSHRKLTRHDAA